MSSKKSEFFWKLLIIVIFLPGCFARELILSEPEINLEQQGLKKIIFAGVGAKKELIIPADFTAALEEKISRSLEKNFPDQFKLISPEEKKSLEETGRDSLSKIFSGDKSANILYFEATDYQELRFIEQPVTDLNSPTFNTPLNINPNLRNLIRYDLSAKINFYLIDSEGKIYFQEQISEIESIHYEEPYRGPSLNLSANENQLLKETRERLIQRLNQKFLFKIMPRYQYH